MSKGELRTKIMDECPDGFEEILKGWIDDLEQSIADVVSDLNIECISDLANIEGAKSALDDIYDGLY
jgi:hypothetical protein